VAVAGPQLHAAPRPDEANSVLSPLNHVLSIVKMQEDPRSDFEDVFVTPYDIQQALSHAELTWAADPFRNQINEEGRPIFNIDFTKNPAARSKQETSGPYLHETPVGRPPLNTPFTRHLGRVETEPSSSNTLRQSFAREESRRDPAPLPPPAPAAVFSSPAIVFDPVPAPVPIFPSVPDPASNSVSTKSRQLSRRYPTIGDQDPREQRRVEEPQRNSFTINQASNTKTTSFDDIGWTPALLQGSLNTDELNTSHRQPKHDRDVFVFYRS